MQSMRQKKEYHSNNQYKIHVVVSKPNSISLEAKAIKAQK